MHNENGVYIRATKELGRSEDRAILVGIVDALCYHEHDRIDRIGSSYLAICRDGALFSLEKHHTIRQLGKRIGAIIFASHNDWGLDQSVGYSGGKRGAEDDLVPGC